jgi:hypothetical protein
MRTARSMTSGEYFALCECHRHEELLLVRPFSDRHQLEVSNHRADQTCGATSHTYTFILGLK